MGLADVGSSIKKLDPSFDARTYGNGTLLALIRTAPDVFEVRVDIPVSGTPPI